MKQRTSLILSLLLFMGCTSDPQSPSSPQLVNTQPFQFKPSQVTSITLAKSDPTTDDRWMVRLSRDGNGKKWEIASPPDSYPLSDRQVDETFVEHLIDEVQNIRIDADAPKGTTESYGLSPPRFALRWNTPEKSWEFRVGTFLKKTSSSNEGYFLSMDGKQVFLANGTALKMLNLIENFHSLRKRNWGTLEPDDIDQIEIQVRGKPLFYAQREGDRWTNRKHQTLHRDIDSLLKDILKSPTDRFIDDASQIESLKATLKNKSSYQVRLYDRNEVVTQFHAIELNHRLFGVSSSRPFFIFTQSPTLLRKLNDATL